MNNESDVSFEKAMIKKSKKPRYRNDNGAFFLFVEVRSGGILGFRCVDKPSALLTLFPCY